jgi:hypothetical protein
VDICGGMWIADSILVLSVFFYLRVSNEFLYYLQEVSLPVLKDSIMEALKVLIGNEFLTSSVNFEMQIFSTSILLVWCFYCLFYR